MSGLLESTFPCNSGQVPAPETDRHGTSPSDRHARWARALSLALHAAGLVCLLTLPPKSGGTGLDTGMVVEFIAPPPAEPAAAAPPEPEPAKPELATVKPIERTITARPISVKPIAARKNPEPAPVTAATEDDGTATAQPATAGPPSASHDATAPEAAGPGAKPAAAEAELRDYAGLVWARIMRHKPEKARYPGTVTVRFAIARDGGLVGAEIAAPSGVPALDLMAMEIIRRAAPFPPPPASADAPVPFNIPFQFR